MFTPFATPSGKGKSNSTGSNGISGSYGVYGGAYPSGYGVALPSGGFAYPSGQLRQPTREPSPSSNGISGSYGSWRALPSSGFAYPSGQRGAAERRPPPSYARRPPARPLSYQTQLSWIVQPSGDSMPGSFRRPRSPLARLYG